MKSILKSSVLSIIIFTFLQPMFSQEAVPFKTQKEFYIYGDATVIGNNILSKDAEKPFNDLVLTNDDIDMVFVDVDKDATTFNSSKATLSLPANKTKIAYATLYWSATYSYDKGTRREDSGQFFYQGKRVKNRTTINKIKFKLPGEEYKNITGKVIFDGAKKGAFRINSPYACKADVTKLLQNANTLNGEFTVANINATKGFVSGGSAGGWLLYVVYEAPTKNPKYITTFDGFTHVGLEPVRLNFKNFQSLEEGDVSTTVTMSALEGDFPLDEDQCLISNPKLKRASFFENSQREKSNFFNSKITIDETNFSQRVPNSSNTLGFDIAKLSIPKKPQPIIDNNTNEIELVLNTKVDRFYLFFTAFQTEISKRFYEEIKQIPEVKAVTNIETKVKPIKIKKKEIVKVKKRKKLKAINNIKTSFTIVNTQKSKIEFGNIRLRTPVKVVLVEEIEEEPEVASKQEGLIVKTSQIESDSVFITSSTYRQSLKMDERPLETQQFKLLLEKDAAFVEGAEKGYYVINKVFQEIENAKAWQNKLKEKGFDSNILVDNVKGWNYVYVFKTLNFYDAFMQHKTLLINPLFEENWVFKVNMEK